MSNLPLVAPKGGKSSTELDVTSRVEELALQGKGESQSRTTGEPKMGKPSARDLLASLSRMRISTTEIQFIGNGHQAAGTYANVAVATFVKAGSNSEEERRVAVKMFRFIITEDMTGEKFLRAFVNELRLLDKLSHPNIANIIGFVEDVEKSIAWLISPWEDNGNLREFLRSGTWEIPERVSLLNILVNSSNRAVITDFGSARILRQIQEPNANSVIRPAPSADDASEKSNQPSQFTVTASGTALTLTGPACSLRWAPPEVLNGGELDLASDIWALGWIAWEDNTVQHASISSDISRIDDPAGRPLPTPITVIDDDKVSASPSAPTLTLSPKAGPLSLPGSIDTESRRCPTGVRGLFRELVNGHSIYYSLVTLAWLLMFTCLDMHMVHILHLEGRPFSVTSSENAPNSRIGLLERYAAGTTYSHGFVVASSTFVPHLLSGRASY
ncbi:hypothetical protein FRC00_006390 [Tulasnella sp. 408]|nr:hypothetical protein FRC00_006390 [Tulasnella sp. 408]